MISKQVRGTSEGNKDQANLEAVGRGGQEVSKANRKVKPCLRMHMYTNKRRVRSMKDSSETYSEWRSLQTDEHILTMNRLERGVTRQQRDIGC